MKIFILIGHSGHGRFAHALAENYAKGARFAGAEVRICALDNIHFDPILHDGYAKIQELEPDLKLAKDDILWADHIVSVYPLWWGSFPAIMKGFVDRVFLPGIFFKFEQGQLFPRKLLKGKSGRALVTLDTGFWLGRVGLGFLHRLITCLAVWRFVGIAPFRMSLFGPMVSSNETYRKKWLARAYLLGKELK